MLRYVRTARPPLTRSAAPVSIAVIRALPTVAATGTAKTVRAGSRSAPYKGLPITFSRPSTRWAFAPIPMTAMISASRLGDHDGLRHRVDAERHAEPVFRGRLCTLEGQHASMVRGRLVKWLTHEASLGLPRAPRNGCHSTQCNARIAYPIAVHRQRHRGRCECEGVGFAVADLQIGRGFAERRGRHARSNDHLVGCQYMIDMGAVARPTMQLGNRDAARTAEAQSIDGGIHRDERHRPVTGIGRDA